MPFINEIEGCDLTVPQYVEFIQRSATAAKYAAKNRKNLLELLAAFRASVLSVTGKT